MHHHLIFATCLLNVVLGTHDGGHISGKGHLNVHNHSDVLKKLSVEEVKLLKMMTSKEQDLVKKLSLEDIKLLKIMIWEKKMTSAEEEEVIKVSLLYCLQS